jgi:transposase
MAVRTKSNAPAAAVDDHIEHLIDQALEYTFPASDPPAIAVDAALPRARPLRVIALRTARRHQP